MRRDSIRAREFHGTMEDPGPADVWEYDNLEDELAWETTETPLLIDVSLPVFFNRNPEKVGKHAQEWRDLMMGIGVERVKMPSSQIMASDALVGLDSALLSDYEGLFEELLGLNLPEVVFGNGLGCATALACAWIEMGGTGVVGSIGGMDGLPCLEELRLMLHVTSKLPCPDGGGTMRRLRELSEVFSGEKTKGLKPVTGAAIFAVESGIHVDGILKDPSLYEPFPPGLVGARRFLGMGVHSGKTALRLKCSRMEISLREDDVEELLDRIKAKALELERGITDDELLIIHGKFARERERE
ncbi:MAG: hypothetical protein LBF41_00205 [Deltaproteobacteria bacterium]|jgi:hypothetical protein|nr:hypothetical protein [Deltaproteobacteria bacterium]